jgi:hypothetical protein
MKDRESADAARYRWARSRPWFAENVDWDIGVEEGDTLDTVDAAIDRAISPAH